MKKLFSLICALAVILTLSACGAELSADEALDIALKQAGVTRDVITNLENKLESDDGVQVYEIDFDANGIEYSFDVNADTGAIVERDRERVD